MLKIYCTKNENVYEKLKSLLKTDAEIKRSRNGKPYIDGFQFSITHTGDTALIAISDETVGIDAEIIKNREYKSILKRFSVREQVEICDNLSFLKHWVVKEAYIKMHGGSIAHDLKRLEYFESELFIDGKKADCNIFCSASSGLIYAVCAESEIPESVKMQIV